MGSTATVAAGATNTMRTSGTLRFNVGSTGTGMCEMVGTVTVYGTSDDLIEVDGGLREEFNPGNDDEDHPHAFLGFSDGTVLDICYINGFWRINRVASGSAHYTKVEGVDNDDDYSDRATLTGTIAWAVCGSAMVKAARRGATAR